MDLEKLSNLLKAISFAARAHRHGVRKDGVTPYVAHVFRVTAIVRNFFGYDDPRMLMTASLHDTIEDTTTDWDDLAEQFGEEVATWVGLLTKDMTLPEVERERAYMAKLAAAPWQVRVCKLADMVDNLLDSKNLPADNRAKTLARLDSYFRHLAGGAGPELEKPLAKFRELFESVK